MRGNRASLELEGLALIDGEQTQVLNAKEERKLLKSLAAVKSKLETAFRRIPTPSIVDEDANDNEIGQYLAAINAGHGPAEARLGVLVQEYLDLRQKLALANLRLVAHVAKRFRDRGIAFSDLIQEGFCGLLEAIDRFDLSHETKLATYATWWIRQAMQRAVAAGAYPVRLSPRHLRQLAQSQEQLESAASGQSVSSSSEMLLRIHAATRPTVSLDAQLDSDTNFSLLQTMSDPDGDRTDDVDMDEIIAKMMNSLRDREQQVLALRFGLGGKPRLSLSQVGKVLAVSKERVRQIQDRALAKLRSLAAENHLEADLLVGV
jgi:RNA polymerase primary sigma factor